MNDFSARAAGVLLPVFSLPSPFGIGDFGRAAFNFVDRLAQAGIGWWQILPLGPIGLGASPYQCRSAFAGEPLFISPQQLLREGLLSRREMPSVCPVGRVDYPALCAEREPLLRAATARLRVPRWRPRVDAFARSARSWLRDYALFSALRCRFSGALWTDWPPELRRREPGALRAAARQHRDEIWHEMAVQFLFARHLAQLRQHAAARGVRILGDMPIFVALDSADVWAHQHLFQLDRRGRPTAVAGVPPDLFSATGQRWGNPLYRWPAHARDGYRWWRDRLKAMADHCDALRIDHFRGFAGYWSVPASARTAAQGQWKRGPGLALFNALRSAGVKLPLVAEDLGEITPDVLKLRRDAGLPGMLVLQFAFGGGADNPYLPHNHAPDMLVYTGTHDNDTTIGWYRTLPAQERRRLHRYLPLARRYPASALLQAAWASVARLAIAPLQDVLSLGSEARINTPGSADCNWCWRYRPRPTDQAAFARLAELSRLYGRAAT
jgi:4-alpha-glucanotransferase